MSDVELFTSTGIPPRFGQGWDAYEKRVREVQAHADKVQKTLKDWEEESWGLKDNPVFPHGCPVITSIFPEYTTNFFDAKVRIDAENVLYVPMVKTHKESDAVLAYAVLRTQRRNVFGWGMGVDGIVSAANPIGDKAPYSDSGLHLMSAAWAFFLGPIFTAGAMYNALNGISDAMPAATCLLASVFATGAYALQGFAKQAGTQKLYAQSQKVARAAGPDVLQFLPRKDIAKMADEGMGKAQIQAYLDNAFDSTQFVTYAFARDLIK